MTRKNLSSRRQFLTTSGTVAATGALLAAAQGFHVADSDTIKVGLIGCGGRGRGAAHDVLRSAPGVKIVAMADAFQDRLDSCLKVINDEFLKDPAVRKHNNAADVPQERRFVGLDAYKKLLETDVNYVMLCTPPGFRPDHIEAAVKAGKNIFTEKPVGVDGPGIRRVLNAHKESLDKKLGIAAGTQRRHQKGYLETMKRVHNGDIGDIGAGRCYWMQPTLWKVERKPGQSDLEWQMRNWYNFVWLCGDHIVEQHVHNIDVINWALKAHPERAVGMGGRAPRDDGYGHIYNFFAIDFEYPKGVHALSMCRQISNCAGNNSEALVGTKGTCQVNAYTINGEKVLQGRDNAPYIQEHTDLIASIRKGEPINELQNVAESTLTAIMGRMSAYTGEAITWERALESKVNTMPQELAWDMKLDVPPIAEPGNMKQRKLWV